MQALDITCSRALLSTYLLTHSLYTPKMVNTTMLITANASTTVLSSGLLCCTREHERL